MPYLITFLMFSFSIVQQPNNAAYVSPAENAVTQFSLASSGNVGLLAHDYLAGETFDDLAIGDYIALTYSDRIELFKVRDIKRYYALEPLGLYGEFKDAATGEWFTSDRLTRQMYIGGSNRLILQTCWNGIRGRLFITAYPARREGILGK